MDYTKFCPGSLAIKNPTPEYYPCPQCGEEVEIWTHELKGECLNCHTTVFKERRPSCIDWCHYAEACFGDETYQRLKGADQSAQAERRKT